METEQDIIDREKALKRFEEIAKEQQLPAFPYKPNRHNRRAAAAIQRKEEREKRKNERQR